MEIILIITVFLTGFCMGALLVMKYEVEPIMKEWNKTIVLWDDTIKGWDDTLKKWQGAIEEAMCYKMKRGNDLHAVIYSKNTWIAVIESDMVPFMINDIERAIASDDGYIGKWLGRECYCDRLMKIDGIE